ncbi:MAG: 5,10-methylenetetrahydrofolate reductase [Phenylobacterium sp.]|jgi:5,10-methylenetetrahydrofolate reductase
MAKRVDGQMALSLQQKIQDPTQGVYLIGTTPPKDGTDETKLAVIADKLLSRLHDVEYDGFIVYDIQDESSRIAAPRPFPFKKTVDPRAYSQLLRQLSNTDVITYKSVAQRDVSAFKQWLQETENSYQLNNIVLVGSPSCTGQIKLNLPDAYRAVKEDDNQLFLGGVTIAERHAKKRNEHQRLFDKTKQGCELFISQAVYDAQATVDLLTSYAQLCREHNTKAKRVILTFTPCGGEKTLEFMRWLGISVPPTTQTRILAAANPLGESVTICHENLNMILQQCGHLEVPLGLNIESLTNRKSEIDASVDLYRMLKDTMQSYLAGNVIANQNQLSEDTNDWPVYQTLNANSPIKAVTSSAI